MAGPTKGMVAGKPIQTETVTKEYEEGHARTFGQARPDFPRGRKFVWDPALKKLVPQATASEYRALDAPVMVDRFYENMSTAEGVDIGSRRKHREYMKANGLAPADDFKQTWAKDVELKRRIREEGVLPDKSRREDVGRALHKLYPE